MCLACEIDALWFAEMERAVPPPLMVDSSPLAAGERSTASASETSSEGRSDDGRAESPSPGARSLSSGRPKAGPVAATDLSPTGRGEVSQRGEAKSAFLCEETRSQ